MFKELMLLNPKVSIIAVSVLVNYSENIHNLITKVLPINVKEDMNLTSKYLNSISWSMIKDGFRAKKMFIEWKTILNNLIAIIFIGAVIAKICSIAQIALSLLTFLDAI